MKDPPNSIYKQKRLKRYANKFKCNTLIETGTYYGHTVDILKDSFQLILTVEVYEPLFLRCKQRFKNFNHIKIFLGDSSSKLDEMISYSVGRCIFWLDGYFSGEGTGKGVNNLECPLIKELTVLKNNKMDNHLILIDDVREMGKQKDYPTLEEVKKLLKDINPNFSIIIEHDCIIAVPSLENME